MSEEKKESGPKTITPGQKKYLEQVELLKNISLEEGKTYYVRQSTAIVNGHQEDNAAYRVNPDQSLRKIEYKILSINEATGLVSIKRCDIDADVEHTKTIHWVKKRFFLKD